MFWLHVLAAILATLLFVYLVAALLYPEDLS
ncbi:K(+)-transporting ATPase subunit F [Oxalobacter paraformigenes]|uniref:K+-transporting ATPase, F subunit n=1 Tax=Oxalobacter paraformigenes TaxID=556268 RepID=T5LQ44_9BURK|nr:K(+)-transporting ATPase subunit F [Oxalobacter paraformigenes]EQM95332.1 K+-transporting ATPase, F subunit [Oxalobacter paraformigenes]